MVMEEKTQYRKSDFYYELPDELIAQTPAEPRDSSRLLIYDRNTKKIEDRIFRDIKEYVKAGDVLVVNNTKVIPARMYALTEHGGLVEVLLLKRYDMTTWEVLMKPGKKGKIGVSMKINDKLSLTVKGITESGERIVEFHFDGVFEDILSEAGTMPLPPYIKEKLADQSRYNTVYSKIDGSAAAPTAGLHFPPELIEGMKARGFGFEEVTLHVGAGTFLPVKDEDAAKHPMHTEHFEVRRATVVALLAKLGAVTAVGTTSVRTLESLPALAWRIHTGVPIDGPGPVGQWELYDIPADYTGRDALEELLAYMDAKGLDRIKAATQIMIAPLGYEFRIVRNIITNFHQPKSTLLLLVSAFAGEDWRRIYDYALSHDFRFLSYGDSSVLMR